ncbi:hypothetical protein [Pseudomonas sp. Irchel 3A7]|uniref:hypothetical protein n=1 Tax=Pseudomonas sp. Irchel 3A7 TaxID=2008913 RepID=UPI0011406B91|nr:hypothetical protein [Pseudomonas sp. Irchel 3A7]
MNLSPSQLIAVNAISGALACEGTLCHVLSQPGFGLTTCLNYMKHRSLRPVMCIAEHPDLSGLDLLGQFYDCLGLDIEFQEKVGIPRFVVELFFLRNFSTIYIDDFGIFSLSESSKRRSIIQLQWILGALPKTNVVISSNGEGSLELLKVSTLCQYSYRCVELSGFLDLVEYKDFFESVIAERSGAEFCRQTLDHLFRVTEGNLAKTMLRLFHPAYIYQQSHRGDRK